MGGVARVRNRYTVFTVLPFMHAMYRSNQPDRIKTMWPTKLYHPRLHDK